MPTHSASDIHNAKIKAFKTARSLHTWLSKNHDAKDELYVKIY